MRFLPRHLWRFSKWTDMKASLYIHIPFCKSKCAYCDFESYPGFETYQDAYIDQVLKEAKLSRDEYRIRSVPSVYIGGGTPSVLSEKQLERLIEGIRSVFPIAQDAEFSMEANPGTVDGSKLSLIRALGVNRLSFGAQAAQTHLLKLLGRIHIWRDVIDAVDMANRAGFSNINIDLMYALPMQTNEDFLESVRQVLSLGVSHLSMYSLILEEGTRLSCMAERGEISIPDDDVSADMQKLCWEECEKHGMKRYEISNYAYEGCECRHNIGYWTRQNYLGLGSSAHSLMNEVRFSNPCFSKYIKGERKTEANDIPLFERMEESIMLETRMTRGLDLQTFSENYGCDRTEKLVSSAKTLEKAGLVEIDGHYLRFTPRGLDLQNAIVVKLVWAL